MGQPNGQQNGNDAIKQQRQVIGAAIWPAGSEGRRSGVNQRGVQRQVVQALNDRCAGGDKPSQDKGHHNARQISARAQIAQRQQKVEQWLDDFLAIGAQAVVEVRRAEQGQRGSHQQKRSRQQEEARLPPEAAQPRQGVVPVSSDENAAQHGHRQTDENRQFPDGKRERASRAQRLQIKIIRQRQRDQGDGNFEAYPGQDRSAEQQQQRRGRLLPEREEQ